MNGLDSHWIWLAVAILLGIAELIAPGVFLIWLAAAAAATGLVTLVFDMGTAFELLLFALFAIAALYFGRRWYEEHPVESSDPLLNDRGARMVGERLVVVTAIEGGRGKVRVGDSVWSCKGPDCAAGSRVRVTGTEGACLIVEQDQESLPPA